MAVSESGYKLAMLDTLRTDDQRRLERLLDELSQALDTRNAADLRIAKIMRSVKAVRSNIDYTTRDMQCLVAA